MTQPWRPQVLWLPMGGLLGALAGALTGMALLLVVMLVDLTVILGAWFGGMAGDLDVSTISADDGWWVVALAGASLLGGPLARWLAGFQPAVPPVS